MNKNDIGNWSMIDNANVDSPERVILIKVKNSDQLKNTLNELSQIIAASSVNDLPANPAHLREYYNALNSANINNNQITGFIADKKLVLKVVYDKGQNDPETLEISSDAIEALENIDVPTIDLQDLKTAPFTFANANVKRVILPDGWGKDDVTAAGEAIAAVNPGFEVALSQDDPNSALAAYVNKPGSLYLAMRHTFYDGHGITKLGTQSQNTYSLSNLKYLSLTGSPAARDFNGGASEKIKFDENGHFVFDKEADETSTEKDAAVGGGKRQLVGTTMNGAIVGANLILLDLEHAIITDEWNSDLTISWSYSAVAKNGEGPGLKEVRFPTTPLLKTLPADCLNGDYAFLEELCIPGNIEVLKTRACWISTNILRHVWTTGGTEHMVYDNGAYLVPAAGEDPVVDHKGHAPLTSTVWNAGNDPTQFPRYGTITLPENLKLIESHNFTARSVSDVYVLSTTAPECHVDAFSTIMYMGNNTIDTQYIKDQGMVTRQAYAQSVALGEYITFLHYPDDTGTPNIQRYTDPTRDYSVATTLRDGKGNVIYFPNQSELNRAYLQGTTGYLWYAWDSERIPDAGNNGDANSFKNFSGLNALTGHTTAAQTQANGYYTANTMTDPDKTDRSFYDVRLDGDGQPTLAQPSGLDWYYNTIWERQQLYPEAKSESSSYVYIRDDNGTYVKDPDPEFNGVFRAAESGDDALEHYSIKQVVETDDQGHIVYVKDSNGNYVEDYDWVADDDGEFVKVTEQHGYASTNVIVEGISTYYSDENGTVANTLELAGGQYYECGTADNYTKVDTNSDIPGAESAYYITNDGGQTYDELTPLTFSGDAPTLYTRSDQQVTKYSSTTKLKYGVTHYYDADGNEVFPTLTLENPNTGTLYYMDSENVRHNVTDMTFVRGEGNYYVEFSYGGSQQVDDNYPSVSLNGTYYYEDGVDYQYTRAEDFIPGTTYYTENNGSYSVATIQWYMINGGGQNLYYVSGSHPTYCDTEGQTYDSSKTYYSDANGTTEATTIHLKDNTYYIPNYVDVYRAPESGEEGLQHYSKNPLGTYHLATAADAGEQRWSPKMVNYVSETPITYTIANDYRGWHQFILHAYHNNEDIPSTPVKFYQTDNDWWTVCFPYDLRYSDMIQFFGDGDKIPYLSKLRYVVRDYNKEKITLMFSKNLMVYKENIQNDDYVHGLIDDETTWPATNDNGVAIGTRATNEEGTDGYDPIILHKGVPYLIKPNISKGANRSFKIYQTENPELYKRLNDAQYVDGGALESYIYKGEYTVPAYVIGQNAPEETTASRTFDHTEFGPSFTYNSGQITYGGETVSAEVSNQYSYTFVGSFFLSLMPKDCYFLGWDSKKGCAAFWYNKTPKLDSYDWNNQTGIICPNFNTSLLIDPATSLSDPAKWTLKAYNPLKPNEAHDLENDNLIGISTTNAKRGLTDMDWGEVDVVVTGIGKINVDNINKAIEQADVIYDMQGVRMNRPLSRLPKGVYIVNGKKYVVD